METPNSFLIIVFFSAVKCDHILLGNLKSINSKMETKALSCQPNVTYVQDLNTCVCRNDGKWPNKCTQFSKVYKEIPRKCNPDTYVQVHCNVCKCDTRGVINYNKCTRHACESSSRKHKNDSRKSTKSVAGTCTPKMWYSYSPCQLCYCVNETRLVCSTIKSQMGTVFFGKYNFTICGKTFLEDTFSIVPNAKKIFRMDDTEQNKESDVQPKESEEEEDDEQQEDEIIEEKKKNIEPVKNAVEEASSESDYDNYSEEAGNAKPNKAEAITQMPFQDESNRMVNGDTKHEYQQVNADNDVIVKPTFFYPELLAEDDNEPPMGNFLRQSKIREKGNQQFIEASVAEVLKKVLDSRKYDFRKMVSLKSNSSCTPGTKMVVECNTCFCMRNGKLLCTKKLCLY